MYDTLIFLAMLRKNKRFLTNLLSVISFFIISSLKIGQAVIDLLKFSDSICRSTFATRSMSRFRSSFALQISMKTCKILL